jgi:molecular chaperone IbpA
MNIVNLPLHGSFRRLDRLADELLGVAEAAPAYDIRKTGEESFELILAVPGFTETDLEIVGHDRALVIKGKVEAAESDGWIRRGIAREPFARRFALGEHVVVKGARLEHGLLHVQLAREVPEALKPRTIRIGTPQPAAAA